MLKQFPNPDPPIPVFFFLDFLVLFCFPIFLVFVCVLHYNPVFLGVSLVFFSKKAWRFRGKMARLAQRGHMVQNSSLRFGIFTQENLFFAKKPVLLKSGRPVPHLN